MNAYELGYNAALSGDMECPYDNDSMESSDWHEGFNDGISYS